MVDRSYSEKFLLKGNWWISGKNELKSAGDLVHSPKSMQLGLHECITAEQSHPFSELDPVRRIIHGESFSEKYTLFDCFETGSIALDGHQWQNSWITNTLAIGAHVDSLDASTFSFGLASFDVLGFTLQSGNFKSEDDYEKSVHSISWEPSPTFDFKVTSNNESWTLKSESLFSAPRTRFKCELIDRSAFCLKPDEVRSIRWFIEKALSLRTLLTLMSGQPVHITELTIWDASSKPLRVFIRQTTSTEPSDFYNLLQKICTLEPDVRKAVFNNFFNLDAEMRIVTGILCASLFETNTYARVDFINLTQALEGFHRITVGSSKYLTDDEYNEKIKKPLIDAIAPINSDLTSKLTTMLEHGNEYSQRQRFRELGKSLNEDFGKDLIPKPSKFADQICDTRNAFTHQGGSSTAGFAENDCFYANKGLQLILLLLTLRHLGVPASSIQDFKNLKLYRFFNIKRLW
ncbi:MAG: hypothetical protein K2X81_25530 [Candidatus Obscuribacterales bacterium]|nr:hypothetical protein [Candidatus Obscuribacterales bacterium]